MNFYRFLADAIVAVHFAYVAFVVVGMLVILVGLGLRGASCGTSGFASFIC